MNKLVTIMGVVLVLLTGCAAKTPTTEDMFALGFEMETNDDSGLPVFRFETSDSNLGIATGYNDYHDSYMFGVRNQMDGIQYQIVPGLGVLPNNCVLDGQDLDGDEFFGFSTVEESTAGCDESQQKEIMENVNDTVSDMGLEDQLDAAIAYFEGTTDQKLPV